MNGFLILVIYATIMIFTTVLFTKKEKSTEGFLVGNRNIGVLRGAMSIAATWIWAPALFVSAEKSYSFGWMGLFWFLVPNILCLLLFIPFAKKIRNYAPKGITLSGYMGKRYNSKKVKGIYWTQMFFLAVLSTAVQLLAGGKILSLITGIPLLPMTMILGVIAFSYSQFSGIKASVATDAVQMVFMLGICLLFVPWALHKPDGIHYMLNGLQGLTKDCGGFFDRRGIEFFLAFGLPTTIGLLAGPFGDQSFWQRAFSIKEKKLGKAFGLGAVMFAIVPLSMGILGFIASGSGYEAVDKGIVNFELISHMFPQWCTYLFLFMIISGLLSTIDSNLCAVASLTSDYVSGNKTLRYAKMLMVAVLMLGTVIANKNGISVTHLFLFYGTVRATTMLPTVLTLCNVSLKEKGVFWGVILSFVIGLPVFAYGASIGNPVIKTIGSLLTLILSGTIALLARKGGSKVATDIKKKTVHYK